MSAAEESIMDSKLKRMRRTSLAFRLAIIFELHQFLDNLLIFTICKMSSCNLFALIYNSSGKNIPTVPFGNIEMSDLLLKVFA
jgi:hypothetical protein